MKFPLVSIITIVFNGVLSLEDTIKSVLTQDYPNIEYIIIDGGSTDGSINIIKSYEQRISKWISESDRGIADAMNKGIRLATGDIIGMIHSDDRYEPGAVSAVVKTFLEYPEAGVVHGNMLLLNPLGISATCRPPREIERDAWKTIPVWHPTMFVRKTVYEKFGFFDLSYRLAMDYDVVLRFIKNGVLFKYADRNIATVRTGGLSWTSLGEVNRETRDIAIKHGYSRLKVDAFYVFKTFRPLERKIGMFLRLHGVAWMVRLYRKIFYPGVPKDF